MAVTPAHNDDLDSSSYQGVAEQLDDEQDTFVVNEQEIKRGAKLRFLVVDRSTISRKFLRHMLVKRYAQSCVEAEDSPFALDTIRTSLALDGRHIDGVFLGCSMHHMDGPSLAKEMRRLGYEGMIAGMVDDLDDFVEKFRESGVLLVLDKPLLPPPVAAILVGKKVIHSICIDVIYCEWWLMRSGIVCVLVYLVIDYCCAGSFLSIHFDVR